MKTGGFSLLRGNEILLKETRSGVNDIVYQHEVIVPDRGLPFKLFLFEGGGGKYIREKHWHRSYRDICRETGAA